MTYLLSELINSLGTVLIRYHDYQKNVTVCVQEPDQTSPLFKQLARDYATKLLQDPNFEQTLERLNQECCTPQYSERKDFLGFIKGEISTLKRQLARNQPFTPIELQEYTTKTAQLFLDFKQLLTKKKNESHSALVNKLDGQPSTNIGLNGLIDNGYSGMMTWGVKLCFSGTLITEEIMDRFRLSATTPDPEIKKLAAAICMTHQDALLAAKLVTIESELQETQTKLGGAELQIKEQQLKINALETKLAIKELELNKTMEGKAELQKIIDQLHLELEEKSTLTPLTSEQTPENPQSLTLMPNPHAPNLSQVIYPPSLYTSLYPFFSRQQSSLRTLAIAQAEPPTSSMEETKKSLSEMNFGPHADL